MKVLIKYNPRPFQREIHENRRGKRFGVLVCHRRFGKTVFGVNEIQVSALTSKLQRPRCGYIGPTYRQAKAVAWDYMQHYASTIPGIKVNQAELRIEYPNGGQVRIYGADDPDALRGLYFDDVFLDEYGLFPATAYEEVIGPTLIDRGGRAIFCGTPNGRNQFYKVAEYAKARVAEADAHWWYAEYKASQTGILDQKYLQEQRAIMTADQYDQEFEASFAAAVRGAIYGRELEQARAGGRVTRVPYEPALPVDTDWDLGIGDSMAIWFSQSTRGGEVRLIDYYEASGEGFPHYAQVLQRRGYTYGQHWAPHDIEVREMSSGRSRREVALAHGIRFSVTPRLHGSVAGEVEEGIHAARMLFPRCWFDALKCHIGLEMLGNYRRDYNRRMDEFKPTPVHDSSSHAADAFRGLAVRYRQPSAKLKTRAGRDYSAEEWAWV